MRAKCRKSVLRMEWWWRSERRAWRSLHACLAWKRTHPCRQFLRLRQFAGRWIPVFANLCSIEPMDSRLDGTTRNSLILIDITFDIKRHGSTRVKHANAPEVPCATAGAGFRGNGATEPKAVIPTRAWISELTFRSTCGTILPRLGGLPLRSAR